MAERVKESFSKCNPHPDQVIAALDKTLYDDDLCLVALN